MPGGWMTYRCERCPLTIELGGFTGWDEYRVVVSEMSQVVCTECGTLHRITKEQGICRVTAPPAPIRAARTVTGRDVRGREFEDEEWFSEYDWQPVGQFPAGIKAVDQLACSHCGQVGQMLSLAGYLYPEGYVPGAPRREVCPLCPGPLQCIGVSDAI
jgi:hypothetical protein